MRPLLGSKCFPTRYSAYMLEFGELLEEILIYLLQMYKKAVNDKGYDLKSRFERIVFI